MILKWFSSDTQAKKTAEKLTLEGRYPPPPHHRQEGRHPPPPFRLKGPHWQVGTPSPRWLEGRNLPPPHRQEGRYPLPHLLEGMYPQA